MPDERFSVRGLRPLHLFFEDPGNILFCHRDLTRESRVRPGIGDVCCFGGVLMHHPRQKRLVLIGQFPHGSVPVGPGLDDQ